MLCSIKKIYILLSMLHMKWSTSVFRKQFAIRNLKVNFILERSQNEKLKYGGLNSPRHLL